MTTKPSVIPEGTKWCNGCSQLHGKMDFATDNCRFDKLRPKCRQCDNRRRANHDFKTRIAANPEAVKRYFEKGAQVLERLAFLKAEADDKRDVKRAAKAANPDAKPKAKPKGPVTAATIIARYNAKVLAAAEANAALQI